MLARAARSNSHHGESSRLLPCMAPPGSTGRIGAALKLFLDFDAGASVL